MPVFREGGYETNLTAINPLLAIEIQRVFACKTGVFGIEFGEVNVGRSHIRHSTPFRLNLACRERPKDGEQEANTSRGNEKGQNRHEPQTAIARPRAG